jgi:hypothetical protein
MNRFAPGFLLLLIAASFHGAASAQPVDASVCDVLANPVAFDGKIIRLPGASVTAGFDEFLIDGASCKAQGAIWLAYPEGSGGKAGPAAFVQLQVAKNGPAIASAPKRAPVTLEKNADFARFDSLLATPYKTSAVCLGCARYTVTATLVGRLDGSAGAGVARDASGKITGIDGFGNLNLYRARLVLQSVSDVVPNEISYARDAAPVRGDARREGARAPRDQVQRAAAAFGAAGEDNGVSVGFGTANEVPKDEGSKGSADSPDGILFNARFDMNRLGKDLMAKAIAHMGTHIADIRGGVVQSLADAEGRAWQVTFSQ